MLLPKRAKFRKQFRGKNRGVAVRGTTIDFGEFGLMAMTSSLISSRQIEAARKVIAHHTKRGGKLWIRIFPDKPMTKKPPEVTMGSGKGDVYEYVVPVKPGRIIMEMAGVSESVAKEAFRLAADKLPINTKFINN